MAGSRLERLGTIFTRVNGLIKSGAMKINDRPLWYDVYRAFPPESPPYYAKPAPSIKVLNIFYPEDPFRAEFHKKTYGRLPLVDLRETGQSQNATKIAVDMVLADQSLSVDNVVRTLQNNNVLQTYNTSFNKVDSTNTDDSKTKSD